MLKFVVLAIAATLCLSQEPADLAGDYEYDDGMRIACDDCSIPDGEYPEEGQVACFKVTRVEKIVTGRVWKCTPPVKCNFWDFFCIPQKEQCKWEIGNISVVACQLERIYTKKLYRSSYQSTEEYDIYSPRYLETEDYPNNTYCVWNVAITGFVSYHIVDQQLQEPTNCDKTGCDCPDSVKITMGSNDITLCGTDMPTVPTQFSDDGVKVEFCSDNTGTAKGFHLLVYKLNDVVSVSPHSPTTDTHKREIMASEEQQQYDETSDDSIITELDHVTCHYDYMMRLSQPDVPCPDPATIQSMLQYHYHLMSVSSQNSGMCSGMTYPSSTMPMMNRIEACAVEYLYRSRDSEFAKTLVNSTNGELSSIVHATVENKFA